VALVRANVSEELSASFIRVRRIGNILEETIFDENLFKIVKSIPEVFRIRSGNIYPQG
jgi:hypothetical protein